MGNCKHCDKDAGLFLEVCDDCDAKYYKKINNQEIYDNSNILIRQYKGNQQSAAEQFNTDAKILMEKGYFPSSQSWQPGSYGCGSFILALLLCFIVVGFLVFIYMLIVKPDGTLTVTYELKKIDTIEVNISIDKTCPQCAETVKKAAVICRYCGYSFSSQPEETDAVS